MHDIIGFLKITVYKGTNLVVRDTITNSSDPYVVINHGQNQDLPEEVCSGKTRNVQDLWIGGVGLVRQAIEQLKKNRYFNKYFEKFSRGRRSRDILDSPLKSPGDKVKTNVIKKNCNPVWNQELTITIRDSKIPIILSVYDKDTFNKDDEMGDAEIDIIPYIEAMKMGLQNLPIGTKVDRVQPNRKNCLADESCIIWDQGGKMYQEMCLRLRNVPHGEIHIRIDWIDNPKFSKSAP